MERLPGIGILLETAATGWEDKISSLSLGAIQKYIYKKRGRLQNKILQRNEKCT